MPFPIYWQASVVVKVVFDEAFCRVYSNDPAAAPGRMESIVTEVRGLFEFVGCQPASESDVLLMHSPDHVERVKMLGNLYPIALLAVGGAIRAAEIALGGDSAFVLIRPPGHHAGRGYSWGFCYFNNVATAVVKMLSLRRVERVLVVDFDLHFGDGTADIFFGSPGVEYFHLPHGPREEQLSELGTSLDSKGEQDLLAVSAGFDRHEVDWGGMLKTDDYYEMGEMLRGFR